MHAARGGNANIATKRYRDMYRTVYYEVSASLQRRRVQRWLCSPQVVNNCDNMYIKLKYILTYIVIVAPCNNVILYTV